MGELFTQCTEALHRFRAQLYEDGTGYSGALDRQEDGLARFAFHFQTDLLGYLTITPDPPGDHVLVRVTTPDGALTIEGTDYLPAPPILPSDPHGKLKRLLRLLSEDLNATLTRPAETPTEPEPQAWTPPTTAATAYTFRKLSDKQWELAFGGDPFEVKHLKGLGYLHVLLSHPGETLSAMDVRSRADDGVPWQPDSRPGDDGGKLNTFGMAVPDGKGTAADYTVQTEMIRIATGDKYDDEDAAELRTVQIIGSDRSPRERQTDSRALRETRSRMDAIKARITELREKIDQSERWGYSEDDLAALDAEKAAEEAALLAERAQLDKLMSASTDKRGKPRTNQNTAENKARLSVGNAITRALGRIQQHNQEMHTHLMHSIPALTKDRGLVYEPSREISWTLS